MNSLGRKVVIVINGKGAAGKDTLCEYIATQYKALSISEITPIKEIAKQAGWRGEKDNRARKMLADLKQVFIEYNNLPFRYAMDQIEEFKHSDKEILFIHIRESEEIAKIVNNVDIPVFTLLVVRTDNGFDKNDYGNKADDNVDDYDYDFRYIGNNQNVEELIESFSEFFSMEMLPLLRA